MKRLIRATFAALAATVLTAPAHAGNVPDVEVLGFSDDGSIFAFEEYGIQDGSGFPYANRFYVDTATDSFVSGTPIRVRLDDAQATLDAARAEAREEGQEIVADDELAANGGHTAGWNPVTEHSADPHRMLVNPRPVFPPVDDPLEFRLSEIPVQEPDDCESLGPVVGYRLSRIAVEPAQETEIVHEDQSIPESRGCPQGYRLAGVQTFFPDDAPPVYALLIAIRSFGFEGPDFNHIAVAGRL